MNTDCYDMNVKELKIKNVLRDKFHETNFRTCTQCYFKRSRCLLYISWKVTVTTDNSLLDYNDPKSQIKGENLNANKFN